MDTAMNAAANNNIRTRIANHATVADASTALN
jgi:hypothetical protein